MPSPVTFLSLREDVRQQTNAEGDGHISEDELKKWVNKGVEKYHGMLAELDEDRLVQSATIATTAGTFDYSVPANFYQLRGLDLEGNGGPFTLRSFRFENRNDRRGFGHVASALNLPRYSIMFAKGAPLGAVVKFDIDPGTEDYTLHYLSYQPALVGDGDEIDGLWGCDDYVIAYASMRVRRKRDESPAAELQEMEAVKVDIRKQARRRHVDGFDTVPRTARQFSDFSSFSDF